MKIFGIIGVAALAALGSSPAPAAEPIHLDLGGYVREWFGTRANQNGRDFLGNDVFGANFPVYATAPAGANANGGAARSDVEIDVKGATVLDHGTRVAVEVDFSPTPSKPAVTSPDRDVKHSYLTISDGFGALSIGERENIGQIIHASAPDLTGIGGQDGQWWRWVLTPTGHRGMQRTYLGDDGVNVKALYLSPDFHGVEAGLSVTPGATTRAASQVPLPEAGPALVVPPFAGIAGSGRDLYVAGLSYYDTLGAVAVKGDLAVSLARGELAATQAGLLLRWAGFALGGSVINRSVTTSNPILKDQLAQGWAWDSGLSYAIGRVSLAFNYFSERAAKGNLTDANAMAGNAGQSAAAGSTLVAYDSDSALAVEAAYDLAKGVQLNATAFQVTYKDAYGIAAEQNRGWGLLGGLAVNF